MEEDQDQGHVSDTGGLPSDDNNNGEDQEAFTDEDASHSPELEWLEELYEEDDSEDDLPVEASSDKKSFAETARMFKLRRNLDQLDYFHRQKEDDVLKAREELTLLQRNIESLLEQRNNLEKEIEQQKVAENSVAVFRLRNQHKNVCQQLQSEEEMEAHINTQLRQQQHGLNKIELELQRFSPLRQQVHEKEQAFQQLKAQKVVTRMKQQRTASQNLQLKIKHLRDKHEIVNQEEEAVSQKNTEEERASRKLTAKYLSETIKRIHQQEAEEMQHRGVLIEKRVQAVKSLKNNIAASQETLRAQQNRARENALKKEQQQSKLKASLQAQGINSIKLMHQQKQLDEKKQKQDEFKAKQRSKRVEIVEKILLEEQLAKRRNKQRFLLPQPSNTQNVQFLRSRERLSYYMAPSPPTPVDERVTTQRKQFSDTSSSTSFSSTSEDIEETMRQEMDQHGFANGLAEPEFSGLWDQNYKITTNEMTVSIEIDEKEDKPITTSGKATSSKKICGKELKSAPFISKPEVIIFKDFEVGETYKKKIILTNSSFVTNYCRVLGVSSHLKDCISTNFKDDGLDMEEKPILPHMDTILDYHARSSSHETQLSESGSSCLSLPAAHRPSEMHSFRSFEAPGSLCAGMSCDMQVTFRPAINEDLAGEVKFASALGPFSVPIRCTIKKCHLEVNSQFIDFGSHTVGQTISRTITLTNKGALATLFSLDTSTHLSPENHHIQIPSKVQSQEERDQNTASASTGTGGIHLEKNLSEAMNQKQPGAEAVTLECSFSNEDAKMDESQFYSSDIRLGNMREGEIGPFESVKLVIIFSPTIPGEAKLNFCIRFSESTSKPIPIQVRGVAVSLPVSMVNPDIDMKICMFDHLYKDTITVHSSTSIALKLTFEVCLEMKKHMEIQPRSGYIQPQSSFTAQLKFLPRHSLSKDAGKYFDQDTGVLEVPMTVQVADKVQTVHFTVQAVVTSSDLKFDITEVDFGYCSIYQSVRSSVHLTNRSLLPQDFGFLGIPEFIDVQPNDGFGTLLPQETLEIDLIFSPKEAKEYNFQLNCKSGINRVFPLCCKAVAVHPPLELSYSLVQFRATAVGDQSTALLYLIYNHTACVPSSTVPFESRAVPAPVTPRLFSFTPPQDSDINISPSAGRLLPGERCLIQVVFRPRLTDQDIKEELQRLQLVKTPQKEIERDRNAEHEIPAETNKGKKPSTSQRCSRMSIPSKNATIRPGSKLYEEARASLLFSFRKRFSEYTVPCFVSNGDPPEEDRQVQPAWSPFNTVYLKLQCTAVQPPLVVVSNKNQNIIDFEQVAIGDRVVKRFAVQNISKEYLELKSSVLDIYGPFTLISSLRGIRPGEKHTLVLAFSPTLEKKYCEPLRVCCKKMTLEVTMQGEGVVQAITSSLSGRMLDFGYVLQKESTSQVVKFQNNSAVTVGFRMLLSSLSPSRPQGRADMLAFVLRNDKESRIQPVVGTQNYSGMSVFTVEPVEGSIAPGHHQDVTVTFQPDHPSDNYADRITFELANKSKVCVIDLRGAASSHNMYLRGGDPLSGPIESLLPPKIISPAHPADSDSAVKHSTPVLVTLRASFSREAIRPAVRELQVGCIPSSMSSKKSGEFYWDQIAGLQQQGFNVEPSKGSVEQGTTRTITLTWTPQRGHKPYDVVEVCVSLTLKGDTTDVYSVTLMALVSNPAD